MFGGDGGGHSKRLKYVGIFLALDKISVVQLLILACGTLLWHSEQTNALSLSPELQGERSLLYK